MTHGAEGLRVLLACDFFVRYAARLADGLGRSGAAVTLLTRDHDLEFGGEPGAARRFVEGSVGNRVDHFALPGRVRSLPGLRQAIALRRRLRARPADIVHVQGAITNDPRLILVAGIRPGRFALTVHDPVPHPGDPVSWVQSRVRRSLAERAGLIFVHGEELREELRARLATRAPIVVVPHGIDPVAATPLPVSPSILFFGRLSHYKGVDVLLDAMSEVWRQLPDATLTVAGDGWIDDHPARRDPRVRFHLGHIPDAEVPELFAAAGCVVLPYRQASQSGVGSLAKRYGRPMVVTSVGALPELVADGSGLIVPPEDPRELASALVSALTDRALAQRLADAGGRTAAGPASWKGVAELTMKAYREYLVE